MKAIFLMQAFWAQPNERAPGKNLLRFYLFFWKRTWKVCPFLLLEKKCWQKKSAFLGFSNILRAPYHTCFDVLTRWLERVHKKNAKNGEKRRFWGRFSVRWSEIISMHLVSITMVWILAKFLRIVTILSRVSIKC